MTWTCQKSPPNSYHVILVKTTLRYYELRHAYKVKNCGIGRNFGPDCSNENTMLFECNAHHVCCAHSFAYVFITLICQNFPIQIFLHLH